MRDLTAVAGDAWARAEIRVGPHGYSHGWKFEGVPGSAEHGHAAASRLTMHPGDVKGMSDADLKAADAEFGRRAELLGKAGQVSKTHKAVKDELSRRKGA